MSESTALVFANCPAMRAGRDATAYPKQDQSINDKERAIRELKQCCQELGLQCECLGIDRVLVKDASRNRNRLDACLNAKDIDTSWQTV